MLMVDYAIRSKFNKKGEAGEIDFLPEILMIISFIALLIILFFVWEFIFFILVLAPILVFKQFLTLLCWMTCSECLCICIHLFILLLFRVMLSFIMYQTHRFYFIIARKTLSFFIVIFIRLFCLQLFHQNKFWLKMHKYSIILVHNSNIYIREY